MSGPQIEPLLPVAEAVRPGPPWLWWARRGDARLAGMAAPQPGFSFTFLEGRSFDTVVSLAGPASYDPAPLAVRVFRLQDLVDGGTPQDADAEADEVARAATCVTELLAGGHGVVVHCRMGIGRTGLVIGAVLVAAGHVPDEVAVWLDAVQRARGAQGWPESQWQRAVLDTHAARG